MSEDSWLFLFAAGAGLGGVAVLVEFLVKVWPMVNSGTPIVVTKSRAVFVLGLLFLSLALSVAGFSINYWSIDIPEWTPEAQLYRQYGQNPDPNNCSMTANGTRFWKYREHYRMVAGCFVFDGLTDILDAPQLQLTQPHDIQKGDVDLRLVWGPGFKEYIAATHASGLDFVLMMVPIGFESGQVQTLRQAKNAGARIVAENAVGFPKIPAVPKSLPQ
jgi:hypothetical protein